MSTENQTPDGAGDNQESVEQGAEGVNQKNSGEPNGEGKPDQQGRQKSGDDKGDANSDDTESKSGKESDEKSNSEESVEYSDFEFPEGVTVDEGLLEKVTAILKEEGVSQEGAQKLITTYGGHIKGVDQGNIDAHNAQLQEWGEKLKSDPEIGGDKYEENMGVARQAVLKFGSESFIEFLDYTGFGNHPEMARFLVNVGKLTLEDSPGSSGGGGGQEKDIEDRWYPEDS